MKYPQTLLKAVWIQRYKRFILDMRLVSTGEIVQVHCANTGSMMGINRPQTQCLILPVDNPKRRLRYTLEAVRAGKVWVGAHPIRANTVAREALVRGLIPEIGPISDIRSEVAYGASSRADLRVTTSQGEPWMIEVKSASLSDGPTGLFPDAVTERGQKHLDELRNVVRRGARALMLFVCVRSDVTHFRPAKNIDGIYAQKLTKAHRAGVLVAAVKAHVTPVAITVKERIAVVL